MGEGFAQHFAALGEGEAHGLVKGGEVVYLPGGCGARYEADDGAIDFRRRVEGVRRDVKQRGGLAPQLCHQAEAAVGFAAGRGGDAVNDFFLQHIVHIVDVLALGEAVKEDGRGEVVGQVADEAEFFCCWRGVFVARFGSCGMRTNFTPTGGGGRTCR